jgi:hypothetical protein
MHTHELRCSPDYFAAILDGRKTFEVRKADRPFKVKDFLLLREYDSAKERYTGGSARLRITYILEGGFPGILLGYCVLAVQLIDWRNGENDESEHRTVGG